MKTRKLYLDTCILVGFYDDEDEHNEEVKDFFKKISKEIKTKKIKLFCSSFSMVEFTKKMVEKAYISRPLMLKYRDEMLTFEKIGEHPITIIKLQKKYKEAKDVFEEFFLRDLQNVWLDVKDPERGIPPLIDVIHATIMKRCKIKEIVTFDTKHFENIKGIKAVLPEDIIK